MITTRRFFALLNSHSLKQLEEALYVELKMFHKEKQIKFNYENFCDYIGLNKILSVNKQEVVSNEKIEKLVKSVFLKGFFND